MRSPIAVLNELSCPPSSPAVAETSTLAILEEFVALLKGLRSTRPDIALASLVPLGAVPISSTGQTFSGLAQMNGGRILDCWRFVQALRNVSPLGSEPSLGTLGDEEETLFDGIRSVGLGVAVVSQQLGVSLLTDRRWDEPILEVQHRKLIEDDTTGEVSVEETSARVTHASRAAHAVEHVDFIRTLSLPTPFSGSDLWRDRANLYPRLEFLDRVRDQLCSLRSGESALSHVHNRLSELNDAIAEWDPATRDSPLWRSNVTPESEARRSLCDFLDVDGVVRCFEMHARFPLGVGRIHFRVVLEGGPIVRVAHVGRKLGA